MSTLPYSAFTVLETDAVLCGEDIYRTWFVISHRWVSKGTEPLFSLIQVRVVEKTE